MIHPSAVPETGAGTPTSRLGGRPPAALTAFLRGVERRGAVMAELHCGDAVAGDAALADAMLEFRHSAGGTVMDDWPRRFWALLLAQPALKTRTPVAIAVDATDRLGELGSGPRAALLLRLAAGLDEAGAAAVLGVRTPTYRLALQRSLPHQADGRADPRAWESLREQVHRRIKTLPDARLQRLGEARKAALRSPGPTPVTTANPFSAHSNRARPAWLMPLLWTFLVICVLAMAATFLPQVRQWMTGAGPAAISTAALAEKAPASRYDAETAAVLHRDFELLADPHGVAMATDLPFHAWLSARGVELQAEPGDDAAPTAEPLLERAIGETSDEHE